MKEYEKLLAFTFLLITIIVLAVMSKDQTTFVMVDGKPVSVDSATVLTSLLSALSAVLGMAGQALFRTSETANAMNELLQSTVDKLAKSVPAPKQDGNTTTTTTITQGVDGGSEADPTKPLEVTVVNPPSKPVPTTDAKTKP